MKKKIINHAYRALLAAGIIGSAVYGVNGAGNIVIALLWITALGNIGVVTKEHLYIKERKTNNDIAAIRQFWNIIIFFTLVWHGWWVTAVVSLLNIVCAYAIHHIDEPLFEE